MRTPLHGLRAPYMLPSNVIYFTDWRYIYPGFVAWAGPDGKRVGPWVEEEIPGGFRWNPRDMPAGIRIRAQEAEKVRVPMPKDKPWEYLTGWSNILQEDGLYRMWYDACPRSDFKKRLPGHTNLLCYAESRDGFAWTKPSLGLCEFDGCRETNIVYGGPLAGEPGYHGGGVFKDPSAAPEERYKILYYTTMPERDFEAYKRARPNDIDPYSIRKDVKAVFGVYGAVSPDGIHWMRIEEPLVVQHSDSLTTAYYDAGLKRFVAYFRSWYFDRRCVGRSETEDFRRWPIPENVLWPTPGLAASDQWYTNSHALYPGTGDYHLMFPALYKSATDDTEIYLFGSADGIMWSQVPGGPVLREGRPGSWDGGCIFAGHGLVTLPGDRVGLPFVGAAAPHKYPRTSPIGEMGYAVWPKGRLAAVEAPESGEFALSPLIFTGEDLRLNVRTGRTGFVSAEIADEKGVPLPGRSFSECAPIVGDSLSAQVTWRGEHRIEHNPEQPLTVRFRMRGAELFSVEFGERR